MLVGRIGIGLLERPYGLVAAHLDHRITRARDLRVAAETLDQHAAVLRARLLGGRERVVVTLAHVDGDSAQCMAGGKPSGIMARRIHGCADDADQEDQHPLTARDAIPRNRLGRDRQEQNFDQPQATPRDEQEGPIARDDTGDRNVRPEIPHQK